MDFHFRSYDKSKLFLLLNDIGISSQNYYFCSLCVQVKVYYTLRKLFQHLHYVYNEQSNFKIQCKHGALCGAIYSTYAGYKCRIYREHKDFPHEELCEELYQQVIILI